MFDYIGIIRLYSNDRGNEAQTLRAMDNSLALHKLGSTIARLRHERNLTQERLAFMSGMNKGYLCDLENGKANTTVEKLVRLADALGVPLSRIFEDF